MGIRVFRTPQRRDDLIDVAVSGEVLTINGQSIDLSGVTDPSPVDSEFVVGPAYRINGDVCVRVISPCGKGETPPSPDQMPEAPVPPPSTDPNDYPLTALEFDAALVRLGIDRDAVAPAIRTIFAGDLDAMADSLARWWNLKTMTRDNSVMGMLKPVFNVTDTQIDTAWMATVVRRG